MLHMLLALLMDIFPFFFVILQNKQFIANLKHDLDKGYFQAF